MPHSRTRFKREPRDLTTGNLLFAGILGRSTLDMPADLSLCETAEPWQAGVSRSRTESSENADEVVDGGDLRSQPVADVLADEVRAPRCLRLRCAYHARTSLPPNGAFRSESLQVKTVLLQLLSTRRDFAQPAETDLRSPGIGSLQPR